MVFPYSFFSVGVFLQPPRAAPPTNGHGSLWTLWWTLSIYDDDPRRTCRPRLTVPEVFSNFS